MIVTKCTMSIQLELISSHYHCIYHYQVHNYWKRTA